MTITSSLGPDGYTVSIQSPVSGGGSGTMLVMPGDVVVVAYYGDSRANGAVPATAGNWDLTSITLTNPAAAASALNQQAKCLLTHLLPYVRITANCGISGDTLDQMITRESAVASATRKALDDVVASGAQVVIFRAGINSVTNLVTGSAFDQSVADSIWAKKKDLLQRAMARGLFILDEGDWAWEHTNTTTYPAARAQAIRDTVKYLNQKSSEFAATTLGQIVYADVWSLSANADGTWKSYTLCIDVNGSLTPPANTQLVHPSNILGMKIAALEAALVQQYFGVPHPAYTQYFRGIAGSRYNMIPNADLSAVASGVGTGWAAGGSGTGAAFAKAVVTRDGKRWQTNTATFSGAGANIVNIYAPMAQVVGGGATQPLVDGATYAVEFDWFVDDGAGGNPGPIAISGAYLLARMRLYTAGGSWFIDFYASGIGDFCFDEAIQGHAVSPPFTISGWSSANITSAELSFSASRTDGATQRIGVASPRLIRVA